MSSHESLTTSDEAYDVVEQWDNSLEQYSLIPHDEEDFGPVNTNIIFHSTKLFPSSSSDQSDVNEQNSSFPQHPPPRARMDATPSISTLQE